MAPLWSIYHLLTVYVALLLVEGMTVDDVSRSNCRFAFDLYKRIATSAGSRNAVFSPLSVATALSMSYLGARYNTEKEMAAVLHYQGLDKVHVANRQLLEALRDPTNNYTLDVANGVFVSNRYHIETSYMEAVERYYDADIHVLDFVEKRQNATDVINEWVSTQTQDRIRNLFHADAIDSNVILLLINAIFFKGWWRFDFDPKDTRSGQFRINDNDMQEMEFMYQSERMYYWKSHELDARILELPYGGDEVSMFIILPNSVLGIYNLEQKVDYDILTRIITRQNRIGALLTIYLPKFKLDVKLNLKNILYNMGLRDSFMDSADLTGMGRNIYLTDVVQHASLEITEEGTTAAAAAGIQIMLAGPTPDNEFRFDHPFMFFIQEKATDNILFMGRLLRSPVEGAEIGEFNPDLLKDSANSITTKWALVFWTSLTLLLIFSS